MPFPPYDLPVRCGSHDVAFVFFSVHPHSPVGPDRKSGFLTGPPSGRVRLLTFVMPVILLGLLAPRGQETGVSLATTYTDLAQCLEPLPQMFTEWLAE